MKILLDTHFAFWWQTGDTRITPQVQALVEDAHKVYVSQVSLWELAIKASLGRIQIDLPVFAQQVDSMGFSWLSIDNGHLLQLMHLPCFDDHKDPFDRILVAQAKTNGLRLMTADQTLEKYDVDVIALWLDEDDE